MRALLVAMVMVMLTGCAPRTPARNVTLGVLDALDRPPADAQLALKLRKLIGRYVDEALAAGPPKGVADISAEVTRGALRAVGENLGEKREVLQGMAAQTAERTGRAMARGMADELFGQVEARLGLHAEGPLGEALAATAQKSASAAVQGATGAIQTELSECGGNAPTLCPQDMVRVLSRQAALGVGESVRKKVDILGLTLAFLAGVSTLGIVILVVRGLSARKRTPAGPTPGA
jgi:hypothetical protein